MTLAALYDIHGNLPALEAVLAEVEAEGFEEIVVGGDVMPGPMPREALALLRALDRPLRFIAGNGERWVLAARDGGTPSHLPVAVQDQLRWVAGTLDEEEVAFLRSLPPTLRVDAPGVGPVLFCHATPHDDMTIVTRRTPDVAFAAAHRNHDADLVVCGHTHIRLDRTVGDLRVVNPGSVGMPFGDPGAYWLALDGELRSRRTEYDRRAAAARLRETRFPNVGAFVDGQILEPPTEDEMLDRWSEAGG